MAYNIELLAGTSGTRVTPSNKLVDNADGKLYNAREPLAHAGTHASGGSDPVTPAAIGAATAAQGAHADSAVQPAGTPASNQLAYWTTAQILAGANLVSCDATNSRIGIGTLAPLGALHVVGNGLTAHDFPGFVATDDSRSKTLGVQGDTFAYLVGYTPDKSFACGISKLGKAFAGSVTAHDFDLRRGDVAKITLTAAGATLPAETASRVVCLDASKTLKSSSVTTTELESLTGATGNIQSQLDAKVDSDDYDALELTGYTNLNLTARSPNGVYNCLTGAWSDNAEWKTVEFTPVAGTTYFATGGVRPISSALAVYFGADGTVLGYQGNGFNGNVVVTTFSRVKLTIPTGTVKVAVVAYSPTVPTVESGVYEQVEQIVTHEDVNYWRGKRIWWCGTSIPAGLGDDNYPKLVGDILGAANVYNVALAGSMCRRSTRTGDYALANWTNLTGALTLTQAECEGIITNWATIQPTLTGTPPATLSASDLIRLRTCSFERKLMPYLTGAYPMPDVFVFDHGHNDWKYTLADGTTTDLDLAPTLANISAGILAEDTYMTASSNANLASFLGSLAHVPSVSSFAASLNRNCFIGAVNFLCTLILKNNPRARIVFIGNYDTWSVYSPVVEVQKTIAADWHFPICLVHEKLGWSGHIIPGTYNYWGGIGSDLTVENVYLADTVHPHSDTSGQANELYSQIIAEWMRGIR